MPQKIFNLLLNFYKKIKYFLERIKKLSSRNRKANIEKKIILKVFGKKRLPRFSQFRYLFNFLNKKERNALILFLFFTLVSVFGLSLSFYFNNTRILAAKGGLYIEGVVGYARFINPLYSQNNEVDQDLVSLIYSGLTKRGTMGGIEMDLAKSYSASEDEKTYTFYLRDNVLWHDGRKFTADDVVFTINAIKEKNYNSPLITSWEDTEVKKIDDFTVEFVLKKPYGLFLELATVGILPKHVWEKVPVASISLAEAINKPIGTGPYRFKAFVKDKVGAIKSYQLEVNKDYYNEKPSISEIILKFYPDYISAINALDNRLIDGLAFVPAEAKNSLKLKSRIEEHDMFLPRYNAIFLNQKNNSVLKDSSIRKALALAIDRNRIIDDVMEGDGVLIEGPILPGYPGYEEKLSRIFYDKDAAQQLLVDAGWHLKDGNRYRTKGDEQLKIVLTSIEKGQNVKAAGIIKEGWESIGVEVELKIVSAANIVQSVIITRNYEAFLFGEMYGSDLDPYQYWHSSAIDYPGLNLAQYSNRKVDALLEQARLSSDKVIRAKKYQEFQALLTEDFPVIFLWQPKYTYFIDKKVKGLQISNLITSSDRFSHLFEAFIKTKRTFK